jgi:hypothetical protein
MKKQLIEEIQKFKRLSGVRVINEGSGEGEFADLLISKLVKTGEKNLPKEIASYTTENGVKGVYKVDYFKALLTKGELSVEERRILQSINKNIVEKVGSDVFTTAIKEATSGLDNLTALVLEEKILKDYFDDNTRAIIEKRLNLLSTSTPITSTINPYETLTPVQIPQGAKDAFIERANKKGIKINSKILDDVMYEMQKSVDVELKKMGALFNDTTFIETIKGFDRLPVQRQTEIIEDSIRTIKKNYGDYIGGLKVTEKTKQNLKSAYNASIDAFWLGYKKRGQKLSIMTFFKWWRASIGVSLGAFFFSIYAEAMRKEDDGIWSTLGFAGKKLAQSPDRFIISLTPGVNLIASGGSALYQTIVTGVTLASKKVGNFITPLPKKGESGLFSDPGLHIDNNQEDPAGIR